MPRGSRPSTPARTISGAGEAKDSVMRTERSLQPSRAAIASVPLTRPATISSSQARPFPIACRSVALASARIGRTPVSDSFSSTISRRRWLRAGVQGTRTVRKPTSPLIVTSTTDALTTTPSSLRSTRAALLSVALAPSGTPAVAARSGSSLLDRSTWTTRASISDAGTRVTDPPSPAGRRAAGDQGVHRPHTLGGRQLAHDAIHDRQQAVREAGGRVRLRPHDRLARLPDRDADGRGDGGQQHRHRHVGQHPHYPGYFGQSARLNPPALSRS